jgi:putative heme-binding domain-containing protein
MMLAAPAYRQQLIEATRDSRADVRLGALLALQKSGFEQPETMLRRMLSDPDVQIRQRALIWAGQGGMFVLKPYIDRALSAGEVTNELFETYLETVVHLMPEYIQAYHARSEPYAKSIERSLPSGFVVSFIRDRSRSPNLRALAIRHLDEPKEQTELLLSILNKEKDQPLRLEVLRTLANIPGEDIAQYVLKIASATNEAPLVRAWALLALTRQPVDVSASVIPLLQDREMDVKIEAARYLRTRLAGEKVKETLRQTYDSLNKGQEEPLREQIALALSTGNHTENTLYSRPASLGEWQKALAQGGEPQRGLRVLYAVQSMCAMCHKVEGTGGELGPDLTNASLSKTRAQLIKSILQPSEEISPEYQGWYVRLKNGEEYQGRQIDVGTNEIELFTQARGFVSFDNKDVEDYGMSEKSLMPDGLENQLTVSDLRDLIAFLEKGKDAVTKGKGVAQIKK